MYLQGTLKLISSSRAYHLFLILVVLEYGGDRVVDEKGHARQPGQGREA